MSSVVTEKQFVWRFIDKVTQGVKQARQAMTEAANSAKNAGFDVKESSNGWTDYGNKAKDAADKANTAMNKIANASRNGSEKVRESVEKLNVSISRIPTSKTFNLKAKFDDQQLRSFSRKLHDVPDQKSIWLRIKDGFSNQLHNAQRDADNTKHSFSNLRDIMQGTFLGNAALNGIYAIGNGMKSLIATGYQYTRQQQTMIASWNTLTGSASKGQQMVDMTNKLAISAQNSTEMVNDLNQKFYAVTNSAGKTQELSKSVLTLQDAFNASDASIENFSTQWAQMVGNGKASAQDMLSIQNVFPKFRKELLAYEREATHNKNLTMQQMNDMMSQGKISSKAMNDVLIGMGRKYQDATKNFTSTLDGMGRIIHTTAPRLLGALVDPFTKAQNPIYKSLSNWVSDPRTLKEFQDAGKAMANAFNDALKAVADLIRPFRGLNQVVGGFIKSLAGGVLHGIALDFRLIGDAVQFVLKMINLLLSPINMLTKHLNGIGGAAKPIRGLGTVIGALIGPLVAVRVAAMGVNTALLVVRGTGKAIAAIGTIIKNITNVTKLWALAQTALNVVMSPWFLIPAILVSIGVGLYEAYKHIKPFRDSVNRLGDAFKRTFTGKAQWEKDLGRQFKNLNKAFDNDAKAFQKKLRKWNTDLWNGMTGNAKWEKDLHKQFDNAKKEYDRYSKQQLKSEQIMQKERQKNWNNFWSGLSKKSRSAWNDMSKHASSGMQSLRSTIAKHSSSVSKTWNNTWSTMKKITVGAWQVIRQHSSNGMETVRGAISSGMSRVSSIWNSGWNSMANFFKGIWSGIKQAAADGMNGVINVINAAIGGINKVWSFFTGHGTGLSNIGHVHFAQGGTVHRHLSVINDGDGPDWKELVQTPDGGLYMSQERNWTGFLPEGTRVYSGPETRQIMNAVGVSHYADGGIVGDVEEGIDWAKGSLENLGSWMGDKIDAIMDFLDDPLKAVKGLLKKATDGMTDKLGHYGELATGALDKLTQPISDWFKKNLEPILDKLEEANPGGAGVARWRPFIKRAAKMEGIVLTPTMMQKMLTQINTESGGNPGAIGGTDGLADGHATGLLQFKPGTFRSWIWHGHGNIMNGFDQILAAFNALQHGGEGGWGNFGIPGKGWATGGEITSQQFGWVGDNPQHHEFVLNPYAPSAEPLLDRAFEATADAQPSGQSGQAGNSKLDRMIELLEILVANVEGLDLNVSLDGEAIRRYSNKENAKEWNLRKG